MNLIKLKKQALNILLKTVACMFMLIPYCLFAQTGGITVKGQVTVNGGPLGGVTVLVQGTGRYAMTDDGGNYYITAVDQNSVLVFTFIGYKTVNETVGTRSLINVAMEEDVQQLEQTVVIGYGTQRKEAVTGSVASISGESMRSVASTNISTALQGRIAGIEMTQTSSRPGAEMQIRIRGSRSLLATNDPLLVLDGIPFPGSINDIDPNSIRSVDVLKDASATAIYGSRGANGVILITTSRGQSAGLAKAIVSYNGYVGVKTLFSRYPMMDGPEFIKLRQEAARTIDELHNDYVKYTNTNDERDDVNTDWQDMLFRPGIVTSHDVSFAKNSETGGYIFGAGYYKDQALIPTQQYTRIALRAAVDQNIGKYFRFGITSNNNYGLSEGNQIGVDGALGATPIADPYDENGNLKRGTWSSPTISWKTWTKETLEEVKDEWLSETKSLASYNNLYGEVKAPFLEGLKYRINLGLNIRTTEGGSFTGIGVTNVTDPTAKSSASNSHSLMTNWTVENLLTYDRTFAEKHQVNVVGLFSAEETRYNSSYIGVTNLPADHFQYYDLGYAEDPISINPNPNGYSVSGLLSWMGRIMYNYDSRYMISATIRSDGSSRLSPGNKWHTYPAVSAGWNIRNESFMQNVDWLNSLKLRVGTGQTSNQAIAPYSTLGTLSTRFYNFGTATSGYKTGYYLSQLPNYNLGWEWTITWNYGLDFSLFNNRLSGTIEYYTQHTNDLLLSVRLPSTSGVGSYIANVGETKNKGFELTLNGVILENLNGWRWEAGINLYTNKNEIVALASGQLRDEGNGWFVGYPIDVVYDYKYIGLWQEGDPYLDILEPGGNVGMIKVLYTGDYNADGTPTRKISDISGADDRQITTLDPDFQGGFNTRVTYKGFDFEIIGAFKSGGKLISTLYGRSSYLNNLNGSRGNVDVDYYTPENTGAKYPRPGGIMSADSPKYMNTLAIFDASYLKIRAITLGYTFNQKFIKDIGISRLRAYLTVQNPFVLFSPYHNESGLDPETNSFGNQFQATAADFRATLPIVGYNTPATRNFLLGLNITF
ncbi:MAG: TonB-dependent receptor [Prevotellaceae bacterium]|jgi:TonB-linked SusC/RagA family outer membrane protein|nr:TonB-dependent receptor [Prevotellaceae bacterium]